MKTYNYTGITWNYHTFNVGDVITLTADITDIGVKGNKFTIKILEGKDYEGSQPLKFKERTIGGSRWMTHSKLKFIFNNCTISGDGIADAKPPPKFDSLYSERFGIDKNTIPLLKTLMAYHNITPLNHYDGDSFIMYHDNTYDIYEGNALNSSTPLFDTLLTDGAKEHLAVNSNDDVAIGDTVLVINTSGCSNAVKLYSIYKVAELVDAKGWCAIDTEDTNHLNKSNYIIIKSDTRLLDTDNCEAVEEPDTGVSKIGTTNDDMFNLRALLLSNGYNQTDTRKFTKYSTFAIVLNNIKLVRFYDNSHDIETYRSVPATSLWNYIKVFRSRFTLVNGDTVKLNDYFFLISRKPSFRMGMRKVTSTSDTKIYYKTSKESGWISNDNKLCLVNSDYGFKDTTIEFNTIEFNIDGHFNRKMWKHHNLNKGDYIEVVHVDDGDNTTLGKGYKIEQVENKYYDGDLPLRIINNLNDSRWLHFSNFKYIGTTKDVPVEAITSNDFKVGDYIYAEPSNTLEHGDFRDKLDIPIFKLEQISTNEEYLRPHRKTTDGVHKNYCRLATSKEIAEHLGTVEPSKSGLRIKTLAEFGERPTYWNSQGLMDYLYGHVLTQDEIDSFNKHGDDRYRIKTVKYSYWTIRKDWVTVKPLPESLPEPEPLPTPLRVKTFKEFGNKRPDSWNDDGDMDYLYGYILTKKELDSFYDDVKYVIKGNSRNWIIRSSQTTSNPLPIDYVNNPYGLSDVTDSNHSISDVAFIKANIAKFKRGDKVIVIGKTKDGINDTTIGKTYTIHGVDTQYNYIPILIESNDNGDTQWLHHNDFLHESHPSYHSTVNRYLQEDISDVQPVTGGHNVSLDKSFNVKTTYDNIDIEHLAKFNADNVMKFNVGDNVTIIKDVVDTTIGKQYVICELDIISKKHNVRIIDDVKEELWIINSSFIHPLYGEHLLTNIKPLKENTVSTTVNNKVEIEEIDVPKM